MNPKMISRAMREWIERDGLNCLKVKLRGDQDWDYQRLQRSEKFPRK